jgi:D-amino-acid oxidase
MIATRRQVLRTVAGAGISALWMPALITRGTAEQVGPLRNGEILPTPKFAQLRQTVTFAAGVRPHRTGGVRLSQHELTTPAGSKVLIHNYGHSGAGITLSWGCASCVQDMVVPILGDMQKAKTPASVAVLGTGVIGLTTATELRRKWSKLPITIYAETLDVSKTTSFVAGGQFEPSQIYKEYEENPDVLKDYVTRSAKRIREIENSGQRIAYGIAQRKNYMIDDDDGNPAFDKFTPHDVVPPFNRGTLPFQGLKQVVGREYSTWLMNPKILLPKLVATLKASGVKFKQKKFADRQQVEALSENIIVNCTGYGAKALFGDDDVHPRRGHLAILNNPAQLKYFFSGGCGHNNEVISYMFARQTDIVVGGTIIPSDKGAFDPNDPDDKAIGRRLLDNIEKVFDGQPAACLPEVASLSGRSLLGVE